MDPVVEVNEADEVARKILTHQGVSDDEFRYVVMFNLTAMTQLLWELSNTNVDASKNSLGKTGRGPGSGIDERKLKRTVIKLAPFAALVAFLAGVGLGYLLP
jgi:hypothetical protein